MQVFHSGTEAFEEALCRLTQRCESDTVAEAEASVREVLETVRRRGDEALLEYTRRWDGVALSLEEIELPRERMRAALETLDRDSRAALELAADRIRSFHTRQLPSAWEFTDEHGNLLGQRVTALERVGVYVPGGKAAYPSSVLMNVLPAKVDARLTGERDSRRTRQISRDHVLPCGLRRDDLHVHRLQLRVAA